jgi:hypothetical protein
LEGEIVVSFLLFSNQFRRREGIHSVSGVYWVEKTFVFPIRSLGSGQRSTQSPSVVSVFAIQYKSDSSILFHFVLCFSHWNSES